MKQLIVSLILFNCYVIATAQTLKKQDDIPTSFNPIATKLKMIPANSPALKLKADPNTIRLSPSRMGNENLYLEFQSPVRANPFNVSFFENKESKYDFGPQLRVCFYKTEPGPQTYIIEINLATFFIGIEEFTVYTNGTSQVIQVDNSKGKKTFYTPHKLTFVSVISNSAQPVFIESKHGSWQFKNLEITPMK